MSKKHVTKHIYCDHGKEVVEKRIYVTIDLIRYVYYVCTECEKSDKLQNSVIALLHDKEEK